MLNLNKQATYCQYKLALCGHSLIKHRTTFITEFWKISIKWCTWHLEYLYLMNCLGHKHLWFISFTSYSISEDLEQANTKYISDIVINYVDALDFITAYSSFRTSTWAGRNILVIYVLKSGIVFSKLLCAGFKHFWLWSSAVVISLWQYDREQCLPLAPCRSLFQKQKLIPREHFEW